MSAEPATESSQSYNLPPMSDSEGSEEAETTVDEAPVPRWSDLSIIERVGLNSEEMSEKDVEAAFSQIALAFRCDQYTLKQRLQAEEHARNLAEENVQLELTRGRETLEMLKGLCLDSKRSKVLQRLELSLDILGGTVERISNTAEVLGAVHQEARLSRAVELMVSHVESVKRRSDRNAAELEEVKKTLQQQHQHSLCRNVDPRASSDPEENDNRKKVPLNNFRRRVSISLIPSHIQEKKKQESKKQASSSKKSGGSCPSPSHSSESSCSTATKDDTQAVDDRLVEPDETPPEAPAAPPPPPECPPTPEPECPPPKPVTTRKPPNKSSSLDTVRQRHKSKGALSRKKEKKTTNIYRRISGGTYAPLWRSAPSAHWLYRCRWALLGAYMLALVCVVSLIYFLWKLQDGSFEL